MTANSTKGNQPKTRDYLAELFVAGTMGDAEWQIFFPKRDKGFDFIAVKQTLTDLLIRPVQVKGLYPTAEKKDRGVYPWGGPLSQVHPELVVAVVYFTSDPDTAAPAHVAYIPFSQLKRPTRGGYRFPGAKLHGGQVTPRRDYRHYFDREGLRALELPDAHTAPRLVVVRRHGSIASAGQRSASALPARALGSLRDQQEAALQPWRSRVQRLRRPTDNHLLVDRQVLARWSTKVVDGRTT